MQENKTYRLFSPCTPIKGWQRSIIADLNRHQILYIPNVLFDILEYGYNRTWGAVLNRYGEENREVIECYFDYLERNELILELDKNERNLFPKFSLDWDFPSLCSNAIMDYNEESQYNLENALHLLSEINCHHVQVRFFKDISMGKIRKTLAYCEKSNFNTIQCAFRFNKSYEQYYERAV